MSLELIPLCTVRVRPAPPVDLGPTPAGRRLIVTLLESTWEGPRLRAHLKKGVVAADWLIISPDRIGFIEIRLTLETHDGALIYVSYTGRRNFADVERGIDAPVYVTPLFETSDARYTWLNSIQAVGKGTLEGDVRVYEMYELR
jgi:hypothetical protein